MKVVAALSSLFLLLASDWAIGADKSYVKLDHGISFSVPAGWTLVRTLDNRQGQRGRLVAELTCDTETCRKHTLETCSVILFAKYFGAENDPQSFKALYADPMDRYFRMRAIRIATSKDAEFRRQLAPITVGARDWWLAETDARHNMKSGLFADTVIGGWQIRVICKTCETGEIRHRDAMDMLPSFQQIDD